MAYVIRTAFGSLTPYLELDAQKREQEFDEMIVPTVNKLKGRPITVCTTLVVDDVIVQKLFDPEKFLKNLKINICRNSIWSGFEKAKKSIKYSLRGVKRLHP